MKKFLLLILIVLVLVLALSSCENPPESSSMPIETKPTTTQPTIPSEPPVHVHTEEIIPAVEPSCTTAGLTEGKKCSDCGEILVAQQEDPITDHIYDNQYDESCNKCGNIREVECAHKDTITLKGYAATCTSTGLTNGTQCTQCGEIIEEQKVISAKKHKEEIDEEVEPTCFETGLTEGKHCSVCNEVIIKQEEIPIAEHKGLNGTCDWCGTCLHTVITNLKGYEATCETDGLTEGQRCKHCWEMIVSQEVIPAFGHTEVIDEAKAPTCTQKGLTEGKHCGVCNQVLVAQTEVPKLEHNYATVVVTSPTCVDKGYTTHTCVCGLSYKDNYVEANGHSYEKVITQPTCMYEGYTTYTCHCGYSYKDNYVSVTGHRYNNQVVINPTCTEPGYTTYTCDCGKSWEGNYVAALGHTEVTYAEEVPPTCTSTGLTEGKLCMVCGEITLVQEVAPMIECIEGEWIIDKSATNEVRGEKHTECTMCGRLMNQEIIPLVMSKGLEYELNADGSSYYVKGMGTCKDNDIIIPAEYKGLPVTSIGRQAFYGVSIDSVMIPHSVTSIGVAAFEECFYLKNVIIPDSVTSIDNSAFKYCTRLESITIPDSVTYIGAYAFASCDMLENVIIPNSVTRIYDGTFKECMSLTSVVIPDSVTRIDDEAFSLCYVLNNVIIPNSVTTMGEGVFTSCWALDNVTISNSLTWIPHDTFWDCRSLKNITIPDSVCRIGRDAFTGCTSLESITIPNFVYSIESDAFSDCSSLTIIIIPNTITKIGYEAFENCESLTEIYFEGTIDEWNAIDLGVDWILNVPATEVICSDGTVTLK